MPRQKTIFVLAGVLVLAAALVFGVRMYRGQERLPALPEDFLPPAEIEAAIRFGIENRDSFLADFLRPWTVDLGYGHILSGGQATVYTPWLTLALLSRNSERTGLRLGREELVSIVRRDYRETRVEVSFYGPDFGFDRDFRVLALDGEREIVPRRVVRRDYDQAREYTITARWDCFFGPRDLAGLPGFVIRVERPGRDPIDFPFPPRMLR